MEERLRSVLKTTQLRLTLKTLIFGGLLLWARLSNFGVLPILVFLGYVLLIYFRNHSQNNGENFYSYLFLVLASLIGVGEVDHFQFIFPAAVFFSAIFYIALGIKELAFSRRDEWNFAKNILLFFAVFAAYFLSNKYDWFLVKFLLIFAVGFLMLEEWLGWLKENFPRRRKLVALVFSFLILQLLWAVSLLPLGFVNSAALMTIFVYLIFDFCANHFRGTITKKLIIKNSIVLFASFCVIFFLTNWKI